MQFPQVASAPTSLFTQRPMTRPTVGFSRMFARPSHYEMRRLYSAWLPIQYQ